MKRSFADRIFLAAQISALLVLALFVADLFLNQQRELSAGEERTLRFNSMMAEHTARTFDAVDILLREIAGELSRNPLDWRDWNENDGWNYLAQRHSRSMPQLRALMLYDAAGRERHLSIPPGKQRSTISQQNYFLELAAGKRSGRAGPFLDQASGQYTFVLSHRLQDKDGQFTGLILAMIEPVYLQEFCWPNRLTEDFEAVLTNNAGQIVAACRPSDQSQRSPLLGHDSEEILFAGALRGNLPSQGTLRSNGFIISRLPVTGFPELRMLTATPESSLLTAWRTRLLELSVLALLIIGIILLGGWLMRQQLRKVATITDQLAASHHELEEKIAEATRELAKERDSAELANVAKSRFLAAASHDLRQPMHALSLFAADLQSQARSASYRELPRLAEQIGASTQLLSEMLDSLLDISRLDVAGITPDISNFPLQSVFERLQTAHRRNAHNKNILLRFRSTRLCLHSDPALVERMLGNLISNALRYTPQGGRVMVVARARAEKVRIEVRDNGIGIAPDNQAAIFSEFYQVANPAREQHQGLGLGLSIVDRLARALNIRIDLFSALNRGTRFALTVQSAPAQATADRPLNTQQVLPFLYFIGDGPELAEAMQMTANWGYRTGQQADYQSALPELPYNTIVFSTYSLAAEVRRIWPGTLTLIVLTTAELAAEEGRTLPPEARTLSLPIRPARLRALLGQLQNTSSKSMP